MNTAKICVLAVAMSLICSSSSALGQAECFAWGGLRGIRVDGQLMAFTTGIGPVKPGSSPLADRRGERIGFPRYVHEGEKHTSSGGLFLEPVRMGLPGVRRMRSPIHCNIVYQDVGPGAVQVDVEITSTENVPLDGIYYFLHLPLADYQNGTAELTGATSISLATTGPSQTTASGVRFVSAARQLAIAFDGPRSILIADDPNPKRPEIAVCFPIYSGNLTAGKTLHSTFTITASGQVDHSPVHLTLDATHFGRPFDGVGGNFRLQSPMDPPIIQYNLDHLRVAWGRVAMPLNLWAAQENEDPLAHADAGKINQNVRASMEMAGSLSARKIQLIISVWNAPAWANMPHQPPARLGGHRINIEKWDAVSRAIGSYLEYLKKNFNSEPELFSFNESDLGIYVLQTPQDHADAIKRLGSYFAAHGLKTKLLLGDTSDPTPVDFINAAMQDPEAVKYIGAVSFHSWRGGTSEQYARWGQAAAKLNVPLLVAEGGTDSDSYAYPSIFAEPWYALDEIGQYVRICAISQPTSILQWQLTHDYSLLSGGHDGQPLAPTQRFWQLKQLGSTPAGSLAMPITCDCAAVAACAYGQSNGEFMIHLVNEGPARLAVVSGIPAGVKELSVCVTDASRAMKQESPVSVSGGTAQFTMDQQSYVTMSSAK